MFGLGFPVELQNRMTSSVSLTVVFWEMQPIDGETETRINMIKSFKYSAKLLLVITIVWKKKWKRVLLLPAVYISSICNTDSELYIYLGIRCSGYHKYPVNYLFYKITHVILAFYSLMYQRILESVFLSGGKFCEFSH